MIRKAKERVKEVEKCIDYELMENEIESPNTG